METICDGDSKQVMMKTQNASKLCVPLWVVAKLWRVSLPMKIPGIYNRQTIVTLTAMIFAPFKTQTCKLWKSHDKNTPVAQLDRA